MTEVMPGLEIAGSQTGRLSERLPRLTRHAGVEQGSAEMVQREGVARLQCQHPAAECCGGTGIASQLQQCRLIDHVVDAAGFRQAVEPVHGLGIHAFADVIFTQPIRTVSIGPIGQKRRQCLIRLVQSQAYFGEENDGIERDRMDFYARGQSVFGACKIT